MLGLRMYIVSMLWSLTSYALAMPNSMLSLTTLTDDRYQLCSRMGNLENEKYHQLNSTLYLYIMKLRMDGCWQASTLLKPMKRTVTTIYWTAPSHILPFTLWVVLSRGMLYVECRWTNPLYIALLMISEEEAEVKDRWKIGLGWAGHAATGSTSQISAKLQVITGVLQRTLGTLWLESVAYITVLIR